jgi:hypothetical protein
MLRRGYGTPTGVVIEIRSVEVEHVRQVTGGRRRGDLGGVPGLGMSMSLTWTCFWDALKAATCSFSVCFSEGCPVWNHTVMYVGDGPWIVPSQVVSPGMALCCGLPEHAPRSRPRHRAAATAKMILRIRISHLRAAAVHAPAPTGTQPIRRVTLSRVPSL